MKRKIDLYGILLLTFMLVAILIPSANAYAAAKVSISNKTLKLKKGVTYQMTLKGTKENPVWKSSKKKIATVSKDGKVKAKKAGKTVISAKLGKKIYKCKLQVYKGSFQHKHKYKENVEINNQYLILDPSIIPGYSFSVDMVSGYSLDSDMPESIDFWGGTGWSNGTQKLYDGIIREGKMLDDTHFKVKSAKLDSKNFYDRGDMALVTNETDVIDLAKLDWYCVHDQVSVRYKCVYCNKLKNNAVYSEGGYVDVHWDILKNKKFTKYVHSKFNNKCTCRNFVRKQYGCWWLYVKMEPVAWNNEKRMTVTSKIIRNGNMESYEVNPIKVNFSRCKHENELVYCGDTYGYGPKNLNINDEEHNRYTCLNCGAILDKKDLKSHKLDVVKK